ncbi:hypothetical protein B9Q04_20425, partial [Candidatus Marsarchaeota G2 archaeon BE_D]
LQQNAFDEVDTYTSIHKQYVMLRTILAFGRRTAEAIRRGAQATQLSSLPVKSKISRLKWTPEAEVDRLVEEIEREMGEQIEGVVREAVAQ